MLFKFNIFGRKIFKCKTNIAKNKGLKPTDTYKRHNIVRHNTTK